MLSIPRKLAITLSLFLLSTAASTAFGAMSGGGMDTGGGDLNQIREARITSLIDNAQDDLIYALNGLSIEDAVDPAVHAALKRASDLGLTGALQASRFALKSHCSNESGKSLAASTHIGDRGGEICINLALLIESAANEIDLYSLVLHEHLHQLGVASEKEAITFGETLAPQVVAYLGKFPRQGRGPVLVPSRHDSASSCLNLSRMVETWLNSKPDAPAWLALTDISVGDTSPSDWYWSAAIPFFGDKPSTTTVREAFGELLPYQIGCSKILMPYQPREKEPVVFIEASILSFSLTHVEFEVSFPTLVPGFSFNERVIVRAPEGESGNRLIAQTWMDFSAAQKCRLPGEDDAPPTRTVESHSVESTSILTLGQTLPERISVSTRLLKYQAQALWSAQSSGCSVVSNPMP